MTTPPSTPASPSPLLVTFDQLPDLIGVKVSRMTLWRWEQAEPPLFPLRVKLGTRLVAWRVSDITEWIQAGGTAQPKKTGGKKP